MSLLFLDGLRVRCPQCRAIRQIPMRSGPAMVQVGDANVLHQMSLQKNIRPGRPYSFHLDAWCSACAAPLLASDAQALAEASDHLLARIQGWLEELNGLCRERLLVETGAGCAPGELGRWLKATFPQLFEECFGTGLCGLYPDHFRKMKKRFRMQAGRLVLQDGLPLSAGFMDWLASQVQAQSFSQDLQELTERALVLDLMAPGPWQVVQSADPWEGVNLNPYLLAQETLFHAAGDPGEPLRFVVETTPVALTSGYAEALRSPLDQPIDFIEDLAFKTFLRQALETNVDRLTWAMTSI